MAFDTTTIVEESIREVVITLAEAVGLVVLVMFVFLQSWRATLIPASDDAGVAHRRVRLRQPPRLLDQHADAVRRGAATGIVVDDAIVVIENIERHIQEYKKPPLQAASDAMGEVFGA